MFQSRIAARRVNTMNYNLLKSGEEYYLRSKSVMKPGDYIIFREWKERTRRTAARYSGRTILAKVLDVSAQSGEWCMVRVRDVSFCEKTDE